MMRTIRTENDAVSFMRSVKFALRYASTVALPLPSIYAMARDQRRAIELKNALLARDEVIETNLIAGRLVLAHRDVVPALYALRTRFRAACLSEDAARALDLIRGNEGVNAGDVRRLLGAFGAKRPDRADLALAELMREMLVDRGPSSVPKRGIPYLSARREIPIGTSTRLTRIWSGREEAGDSRSGGGRSRAFCTRPEEKARIDAASLRSKG